MTPTGSYRKRRATVAAQDGAGEGVRAVTRALDLLMALARAGRALSVAEMIEHVDLARPTLYRLLQTLTQRGFVAAAGEPQRFRLGPAVAQLAHAWGSGLKLADLAEPTLRGVWQTTGETVALFVPEGLMRVCVAELPSVHPLSFKRGVGYRERLVLGASGRAILAYAAGDAELRSYAAGLDIDVAKCRAELERVRRRGYAVSRDELIEGAVAVAAPFFDGTDRVAGSIGIFGPGVRLPAARVEPCGQLLIRAAAELSAALGHTVPAA